MGDELAQGNSSPFADPQQGRFPSRGVLPWYQPEPSRQLATVLERVDVTDSGQQGRCDLGSDARDRLQTLHPSIRQGDLLNLLVVVSDPFVEMSDFLIQPKQLFAE